jgi:hypothetical protein
MAHATPPHIASTPRHRASEQEQQQTAAGEIQCPSTRSSLWYTALKETNVDFAIAIMLVLFETPAGYSLFKVGILLPRLVLVMMMPMPMACGSQWSGLFSVTVYNPQYIDCTERIVSVGVYMHCGWAISIFVGNT